MTEVANVLLVEDNPGDARLIQEMIEENRQDQFRLWRQADRLSAGLDHLARGDIGMVLLDLSLPDSFGLDTFSAMFQRAPHIPIIVLTGTDDELLASNAVKTGAQDYLVKGRVDADLLQRAMRYAFERKQAENALRESEERYALAAAGSNDGLWDWQVRKHRIYLSPRWKSMLGYAEQEIDGNIDEWLRRIHRDDLSSVRKQLARCLAGHHDQEHLEFEYRMLHKDGTYRWMLCRGIALFDADGRASRLAGSQADIHDRKLATERLLHSAIHDSLTGLPNRAFMLESLQRAIDKASRRPHDLFAVLFIDLDRFKNVNDSLGHMVGDRFLVESAQRLTLCCRPADTLARLGGDEFVLLLEDISGEADAIRVAERVQAAFKESFTIQGHELYLSASIGVALSASRYALAEEMLRDADTAMYRAKAQGKSCYSVFDAPMHANAVAYLKLEADLRRAVGRQAFFLQYQPVVALASGKVVGFEALLRWNHEQRGPVAPTEFIAIAEETGLIVPLGKWVLHEACRQLASWLSQYRGIEDITVSVNLSSRQFFADANLVAEVADALESHQVPPARLKLEITESLLMADVTAAAEKLRQLKATGVRICMDDFGTGYSSLAYLHRFPVDTLKIDQSFIHNMDQSSDAEAIVRAIVGLAQFLKMDVVAEGAETAEQVRKLAAIGCPYVQGHFFSRPLPKEAAIAALRRNDWRPTSVNPISRENCHADSTRQQHH